MNFILAWVSGLCVLLLCVIYPIRMILKKYKLSERHWIRRANRFLRRKHKTLGIVTVVVVFLHGRIAFHNSGIRSIVGVVLLLLLVLISLTYCFRYKLSGKWIKAHRILTLILIILMVYHMFLEF